MTTRTAQPATFSLASNAMAVGAALVLGAVVASGMGLAAGWADGVASQVIRSAVMGLGAWLIAASVGVFLLNLVTSKWVEDVGMGVLASSMARMLTGLMLSLLVYFVFPTDGKSFWACVLVAGLLGLAAETSWAVQTLAKLAQSTDAGTPRGSGVAQ